MLPPSSPKTYTVPQCEALTLVLKTDDEDALIAGFKRLTATLRLQLQATRPTSPSAVDIASATKGGVTSILKPPKPLKIPMKEFVTRCRQHRERNLMVWSRAVRKAYEDCLQVIEDIEDQRIGVGVSVNPLDSSTNEIGVGFV